MNSSTKSLLVQVSIAFIIGGIILFSYGQLFVRDLTVTFQNQTSSAVYVTFRCGDIRGESTVGTKERFEIHKGKQCEDWVFNLKNGSKLSCYVAQEDTKLDIVWKENIPSSCGLN